MEYAVPYIFLYHTSSCGQQLKITKLHTRENFELTEYPRGKISDPQNSHERKFVIHEEKFRTHEIPTRESFEPTIHPREKVSDPRNTHENKLVTHLNKFVILEKPKRK